MYKAYAKTAWLKCQLNIQFLHSRFVFRITVSFDA